MSQRTKTLTLLRNAGERGVTNSEFIDWRIFRYAARLHELREEGFEIRTEVFGSKATYKLVSEPGDVDDGRRGAEDGLSQLSPSPGLPTSVAVVNAGTLFPVEHEPRSPYDPMSEAA